MQHHLFFHTLRRISVIFSLSLLITSITLAQQKDSAFAPTFMVGATGGLNMSKVIFQPTLQQELQNGFDAGIIFRYDAIRYAGIWIEIDYSKRGWREVNDNHPTYRYNRHLSFINLPVMTHFMIGKGSFKVTIDAGTHFGYFLSSTSNVIEPVKPDPEKNTIIRVHHSLEVENKIAWGLGGGVGMEYHLPKLVVGIRSSYVYGLGDLFKNDRTSFFVKSSEQIFAGKLYLFYKF